MRNMRTLIVSTFFASVMISARVLGSAQRGNNENEELECTTSDQIASVLAYVDWPFRVDCDHLKKVWRQENAQTSDNEMTCRLYHNGILQTSNVFTLSSFEDNRTFVAHLYANNTRCLRGNVQIDLRPFPNEACQNSRDDPNRLIYIQRTMKDLVSLDCGIANGEYPDVIPEGAELSDFTTVWITENCSRSRYRSNMLWENIKGPGGFGDTLLMPTIDFYDAVNFTCSVKYKGKTLYPVTYSMCVKQRANVQNPILTCVSSHKVERHGEVKFDCTGQMSGGFTEPGDFEMLWQKDGQVLCKNEEFEADSSGVNERFSCIADDETDNVPFKCLYDVDTIRDEDIQHTRKKINLNFTIKDVQSGDYGNYEAVFRVKRGEDWLNEKWLIAVTGDQTSPPWLLSARNGAGGLRSAQNSTGGNDTETCSLSNHNTSVLAYVDWPFRVDCDHLKKVLRQANPQTSDDELTCRLYRNGIQETGNVFVLSSFEENGTFAAHLYVNNTRCLTGDVRIDLRPFPSETCQTSRDDPARFNIIERTNGDQVKLDCGMANGEYPDVIPEGAKASDFTTVWITDRCNRTRYRTNKLWENIDGPTGFGETLHMPNIDFYDSVNFTCSVSYKGKTLYPVTYSMCMRQRTIPQNPTLTCVNAHDVVKHGEVEFDCSGQMTAGFTKPGEFQMKWMKDDRVLCVNKEFETTTGGVNGRFSCIADDETNNVRFQCLYDPTNDEVQDQRKKIKLHFTIKDVQSGDYGNYTAVFQAKKDDSWLEDKWKIVVTEDQTPYYEMLVKVLSSVLAVIIVITAAIMLVWKYRIYFLVLYKRSRLWNYDSDDKEYVAYISYHFDNSDDSEDAKLCAQYTDKIVTTIHSFMETNGHRYYDEQKDAHFGAEVEKITNLVEKCHRMLLVLTPKYLDDRWLRFHAELGFHGQLESKTGLVLIVTPGVKKLLRKRARKDKVWNNLNVAMRTSRIIKWTDTMNDDVLQKHLEYLMPKLKVEKGGDEPKLQARGDVGKKDVNFSDISNGGNTAAHECVV